MLYQLYLLWRTGDNCQSRAAQKKTPRLLCRSPGAVYSSRSFYRRLFSLDSSRSISRYNHTIVTMMPKAEYHSMYLGAP
jgi:hypothetical protein